MPKRCDTGLTKNERGYSRTIGYYIYNGARTPRKFRLGHDRASAKRKVEALETAWEGLPGERGKKIWTDDAIRAALEPLTASVAPVPIPALLATVPPVAMPVFSPEPDPPPPPIRTYTLPDALDEFTKYFDARSDISQAHRDGTKSR